MPFVDGVWIDDLDNPQEIHVEFNGEQIDETTEFNPGDHVFNGTHTGEVPTDGYITVDFATTDVNQVHEGNEPQIYYKYYTHCLNESKKKLFDKKKYINKYIEIENPIERGVLRGKVIDIHERIFVINVIIEYFNGRQETWTICNEEEIKFIGNDNPLLLNSY
jgi:hypothetical protein